MSAWNPDLYGKFERERTRAARDLLANVPLGAARLVYDLGCGPGNSTQLLARRFPEAKIVGIDTSEAMLAWARRRLPSGDFIRLDIAQWTPERPPDVIFANAALQFVPDHEALLPRLMASLAPGGCLAVQMPDVLHESSHTLMRILATEEPWADRLVPVAKSRPFIASPAHYYDLLRPRAASVEVWTTAYFHPLESPDAVVDWFAGSALLPYLDPLSDDERCAFLARYRKGIADAYPQSADGGLLLVYPRVFLLATRAVA